jgi:FkbM family methyltransferase
MTLRNWLKYWFYSRRPGIDRRFPYYGTNVYFPSRAAVFRLICRDGAFEPEIIQRLIAFTRPNTSVFDIGANIGLMSVPVLKSCSTCRVVSFEPSPNSLPYLQRTAHESSYRDRWTVIGKAVSAEPGELEFVIGQSEDGLFEGFKSANRLSDAHTIKVPVTSVDDEWGRLGKPTVSVLKIDVEGAEGLVLAGSREVLNTCRPHLIIEWHEPYLQEFGTSWDSLLSIANEHGYRIYTLPAGIVVDDKQSFRIQLMVCSNFVLAPCSERAGTR